MHLDTKRIKQYKGFFLERSSNRHLCILQKFGQEVVEYIDQYADLADPGTEMLYTSEKFNLEVLNIEALHTFVNFKRVNDLNEPNEFFGKVNKMLPQGGYYIGCFESIGARKRRILNKYPRVIAQPVCLLDFILKRIFPKLRLTRRIYNLLTRGENRATSITETFGRLASCGFELTDYREIGYLTYFVCRKTKEPLYSATENCGFVIKLRRIGMGGKVFNVYKFRTMHPYAEYLQTHIYKKNDLCSGCKFLNDFRITSWGRIMRKFWIDELPMFTNWFRRELKIVGVRPLSEQFFNLYPEEFRRRRINYKPGLLPPFYADLPKTMAEVVASEERYLDAYDKQPWLTDIRYFWIGVYNILIKRARSA